MFLPYLQIIKLNYYHSGKSEKVVSLSFGCSHLVCAAPRVWRADGVSNPNYRGRSWCGQASHQPGSRGARGQGQPIPGDYRHNKVCFRQCSVAGFFVSPLASGVKAAFKISSKKHYWFIVLVMCFRYRSTRSIKKVRWGFNALRLLMHLYTLQYLLHYVRKWHMPDKKVWQWCYMPDKCNILKI